MKLVLFVIAVIVACSFYLESKYEVACAEVDEIVEIGGCDRSGNCGVKTSQSVKRISNRPVIGDLICLRFEIREKLVGVREVKK